MAQDFVNFVSSLPNDKLMALAKPIGSDRSRSAIVQHVLDKFGLLGWEKMLNRLDTTTLQALGEELAVETGGHDNRALLLKEIPKLVSDKTHETLAALSNELIDIMWQNLGIEHSPDLETLVLELFIGGIEAIVGIWTITQMNDIIELYQIQSRNLKLKDEIVFDIVAAILQKEYQTPALELPVEATVPQTPRSPIRPADDRPMNRRRPAAQTGKGKVTVTSQDKENAAENELASAVVALKFEDVPQARPRRQTKSRMGADFVL